MPEIGISLRNARVQRGLTIDQVAQETRISSRFLEALEAEAFDELPAPVYVRGFLRSYANFLRLDAQPLLDRLAQSTGSPLVGPDSFVGGPASPKRAGAGGTARPGATSNPFQRTPPVNPVVNAPGTREATAETPDEAWAPEPDGGPAMDWDSEDEAPEYDPGYTVRYAQEDMQFRPRRVAGVLTERDGDGSRGAAPGRLLALLGAAVGLVILGLAVAVLLTRGGGNGPNQAAAIDPPTPTSRAGTVVAVGTQARPSTTASPAASPSPSPSPSASPAPSGTPASASPTEAAAAPTAAPTATESPTATPTSVPPTPTPPPTPVPPTATPIPVPAHPNGYALCAGTGNCGNPDPSSGMYVVICPPDGTWYVDPQLGKNNPHGWPTRSVVRLKDSETACS